MKKFALISLAALAAAFSSCSKSQTAPTVSAEGNFSIYADITKTVNDGMSTNWADGDEINVFHISEADWTAKDWTKFTSDGKFTLADATKGQFLGTANPGEGANRWYAFYPYSSYLTTPDNTDDSYGYICSSGKNTPQKQNGNNSTAHLAGRYFPLYAQSDSWSTGTVTLAFKPLLSVVKFHVTNNSDKALTVATITLTAEEDITGSYYINFAGETPVFNPSTNYVSNTASLSVVSGTEIAKGGSADFYLAIKPFTNAAGKTIKIAVNGYEKSLTTTQTFAMGKIKTINFNYDEVEKDYSGTYAVLAPASSKYYALKGEADGNVLGYQEVSYDGTSESVEISTTLLVWEVAKTLDGTYTFKNKSNGKYLSNQGTTSNAAYVVATLATGCYMSIIPNDTSFNIFESSTNRPLCYNSGSPRYAFYTYLSSGVSSLKLVKAKFDSTPVINPITDPDKVDAAGASGVEVSYTVTNPVEGKLASATADQNWISNINCSTYGKISFDVAANEGTEERSATVTVSYEGAKANVTFTVTQGKPGTGNKYTWTLASGQISTTTSSYKSGNITWSYTAPTYVGFDNTKGAQIGSSSNVTKSWTISTNGFTASIKSITVNASMGSKGDAKLTISVGGTDVLSNKALTTSATDYAVTGINKSGEIKISFAASAKAYYLKSIVVEY